LAATYWYMGLEKEARAEIAEVLKIDPKFSLEVYTAISPFKNPSGDRQLRSAFAQAGAEVRL